MKPSNICKRDVGLVSFLEYKDTLSSWFATFFATISIMCSLNADPSILSSNSSSNILTSPITSCAVRVIFVGVAVVLLPVSSATPLCAGYKISSDIQIFQITF